MKYIIDKQKRPVYLQLYNQIRDDIVNEIIPFNSKFTSIRMLADELGISTVTALPCQMNTTRPTRSIIHSGLTRIFPYLC